MKKNLRKTEDHIFVQPEVATYPKKARPTGGYPPTKVQHEENDETRERQKRGLRSWLQEIVTETRKKELRDEVAYFVVDFRVKADHPSSAVFLKKLQSKLLTFLDEDKTKVLVASGIDTLDQAAKSVGFPQYMTKIVFDVRPIRMNEQIDQKILSDKTWMEEAKNVNIFVVPNVSIEKLEKYIGLTKDFLQKNDVEIRDSYVDKFSSSGVLNVKINFPTTSKLLQSSSFVFRVHETPKLEAQGVRKGGVSHVVSESESASRGSVTGGDIATHVANLPEVCVIDTGVNHIAPLQGLISYASKEPNMPDDFDHNDHGTSVAYLAAYGEGSSPRARLISHKILSGSVESNLFTALARAIISYLHRTRIFTCSINFQHDNPAARFETWKIDRLVQASNACIIFSAGNIEPSVVRQLISSGFTYPTYLENNPIMHPSDAIAITAVGSYCRKSNANLSIAPQDSPSPFTRYSTINRSMRECVKPELVEHGGNLNSNYTCSGVGVETFSSAGNPVEKIGTSFSSPIVAGHLAEVIQKYGSKIRNVETLKAIAYSSCLPTHNHPKFVGLGKPDCGNMLGSSFQSARIVFEGVMRLAHPQLKDWHPANKISVYVPARVDRIELLLVHTDNYDIPSTLGLYTYIEVVPEKPARESPPQPDQGDLNGREHVKRLVWHYEKAVRGFWFFTFVPHHIGIPQSFRENVTLRYGGVLTLTTSRTRHTSLSSEVRRNLKEKT
jgi:hypothetical protein